jgi:predicted permease
MGWLQQMFRRRRRFEELSESIREHLDEKTADLMDRGLTQKQAEQAALREFGNVTRIEERSREVWKLPLIEDLLADSRFAFRQLWKSPGFALTALLTLALGIGTTTAAFSLVDAVLLRALPYRDSNRLVEIYEDHSGSDLGLKYDLNTPGGYADLKGQGEVFQDVAAVDGGNQFGLQADGGEPRTLTEESVTWNLFPMLGVNPLVGRLFREDEDRPGHEHVVLLSFRLWQERFAGDRSVIGHEIRLDNRIAVERYTVVGIMPPHFSFPEKNVDIWIPRAFSERDYTSHGEHYVMVFAHLKDGVSVSQANSALQSLAVQTRHLYPFEISLHRFFAESLQEAYTRDARRGLLLLMTAGGFILLIACANLANLLLARALARRREIGLRAALGAGRGRLVAQLLTEGALLGLFGGALGMALAWTSFVFLKQFIPADLSSTISLSINLEVLGFVLLISLVSSFLFGLVPALRLSGSDLTTALREGARGSSGPSRSQLGTALAAAEIALSLLLLVGGGLLLKSFLRLRSVDPGFRSDHVLVMGHFLKSPPSDPSEFQARMRVFDRMLDNVRALPGVKRAGFTSELPLGWAGGRGAFLPEGAAPDPSLYGAHNRVVTPGYFETIRIPLIRGRFFNQDDIMDAPAVAIINQTMARTFWPNEDPIGRRLKYGGAESHSPWAQIVGIVGDVRQVDLSLPPGPEMYFPHWQALSNYMTPNQLVVETAGNPMGLALALRSAIQSVDPEQPAENIYPLDDLIDTDIAPRRLQAVLIGSLALLALVIASVGMYGLMAYLVSQRTQEMGIRMALGAKRSEVLALVFRRGAKIALIGLTVGICAAAGLTGLMRSLLFEVSVGDPGIFAAVIVLLLLVSVAACLIPARRAASVDLIQALRSE